MSNDKRPGLEAFIHISDKDGCMIYPHNEGEIIHVATRRGFRPTWFGPNAISVLERANEEIDILLESQKYIWNPKAVARENKPPQQNRPAYQNGNKPAAVSNLPSFNGGNPDALWVSLDDETVKHYAALAYDEMWETELQDEAIPYFAPGVKAYRMKRGSKEMHALHFVGYDGQTIRGLFFTDASDHKNPETASLNPYSHTAKGWPEKMSNAMWKAAYQNEGKGQIFWVNAGIWIILIPTPDRKGYTFSRIINNPLSVFSIEAWTINQPTYAE